MTTSLARFRERSITFANGSVGQNIDIPSANPSNYYQAISRPADMPRVVIDGKLFLPPVATAAIPRRSSSSHPAAWASPPRTWRTQKY